MHKDNRRLATATAAIACGAVVALVCYGKSKRRRRTEVFRADTVEVSHHQLLTPIDNSEEEEALQSPETPAWLRDAAAQLHELDAATTPEPSSVQPVERGVPDDTYDVLDLARAPAAAAPGEAAVYVCMGPACQQDGAASTLLELEELAALAGRCAVRQDWCFGLCGSGPNVLVEPSVGGGAAGSCASAEEMCSQVRSVGASAEVVRRATGVLPDSPAVLQRLEASRRVAEGERELRYARKLACCDGRPGRALTVVDGVLLKLKGCEAGDRASQLSALSASAAQLRLEIVSKH